MTSFLKKGYEIEKNFGDLISKFGKVEYADSYTDIHKHWDLKLTTSKGFITFDVKGMRKINRSDNNYNENIQWIEFVNVNGDRGWIYGEAKYIVFERENDYVMIKRTDIIEYLNNHEVGKYKQYSQLKEPYKLYKRYNRKDVIMLVYIDDFDCEKKIIKKIST